MAQKRTYEITITVKEGWDAVATETIRVPVTIDLTLLQSIVGRKIGDMYETVEEMIGPPEYESETVVA